MMWIYIRLRTYQTYANNSLKLPIFWGKWYEKEKYINCIGAYHDINVRM